MRAQADVEVYLTNSAPDIVEAPQTVQVKAGSTYVQVSIKSTPLPGAAEVVGVAEGYGHGSVTVHTVDPSGATPPYQLHLHPAPPLLYAGSTGKFTVALTGSDDVPVNAPRDIPLVVTSSRPDAVQVPQAMTTPRLSQTTEVEWKALGVGEATVTVQSQGFSTVATQSKVMKAGGSPFAWKAYSLQSSYSAGTD